MKIIQIYPLVAISISNGEEKNILGYTEILQVSDQS